MRTYKNVNWHFLAESLELTCLALLRIYRALFQMCVGFFCVCVGLLWHLLAESLRTLDFLFHNICKCVCVWKNTLTSKKIRDIIFPRGVSWIHMFGSFVDIQGSFPEACRSLLRMCRAPLALACRSRFIHDIYMCVCVQKTHTSKKTFEFKIFLRSLLKFNAWLLCRYTWLFCRLIVLFSGYV